METVKTKYTDTELEEVKLLKELGMDDLGREEELPEIDRSDLKEIIEERLKKGKLRRKKTRK